MYEKIILIVILLYITDMLFKMYEQYENVESAIEQEREKEEKRNTLVKDFTGFQKEISMKIANEKDPEQIKYLYAILSEQYQQYIDQFNSI